MITHENYKNSLVRLKWLIYMADTHKTKIYEAEITELSDGLEIYELNNFPIEEPNPIELVKFHLERLSCSSKRLAKEIGISHSHFLRIINKDVDLTKKMSKKLSEFNYIKIRL